MERIIRMINEYELRAREACFELLRDPYMALADCDFTRRALGREESLPEGAKKRIERELGQVESQATFDLNRMGYGFGLSS